MHDILTMIYDLIGLLGGIVSILLTIYVLVRDRRKEKISVLKEQVIAYYLLEQQYIEHIAKESGKNPKTIQTEFRNKAQNDERNVSKTRPKFTITMVEKMSNH